MNNIAIVASVVCIASLGCSIVSSVAPEGSTRKALNIVLGVFILCSMLVPIKNAIADFNVNISITQPEKDLKAVADEAYNTAIMEETKAILESTLFHYLESNKIKPESVQISLASYDNGGIYIDKISIFISKVYINDTGKIIKLTRDKFDVTPRIVLR